MVGFAADFDQMVARGAVEGEAFSFFCFDSGTLIAVDSINALQDHMTGRRRIGNPTLSVTPEQAADLAFGPASAPN